MDDHGRDRGGNHSRIKTGFGELITGLADLSCVWSAGNSVVSQMPQHLYPVPNRRGIPHVQRRLRGKTEGSN